MVVRLAVMVALWLLSQAALQAIKDDGLEGEARDAAIPGIINVRIAFDGCKLPKVS
jgi:hypothetical protein